MIDAHGRTVTVYGGVYTVTDGGTSFSVTAPNDAAALAAINATGPPVATTNPTTIPALAFLNRFTTAEQAAVWQAATANAQIGVGLQTGLAAGQINLTDSTVSAWMAALVAAGAITSARSAAILTP